MTPDEIERLAIVHRATTGLVPPSVWDAMSPDARLRVGRLTQSSAQRLVQLMLDMEPGEVEVVLDDAPAVGRTTTPRMGALTRAALVALTVAPEDKP